MSNRSTQQCTNRVRDNKPCNPNSRVNQRIKHGIHSAATYLRNNATINENHASTSNEQTNRNDNRTTTLVRNNSNINNTNLLSDVNNIEKNTINSDESNEVIGTFTNSEGRIVGAMEEDLQVARVQGPQPKDTHLLQMT